MATPDKDEFYRRGQEFLKLNQPEKALECFKKISEDFALYEISDFEKEDYLPGILGVARIREAQLYTGSWTLLRDHKLNFVQFANRNPGLSNIVRMRVTSDRRYAIVKAPPPNYVVPHRCIFLGGSKNYCHWYNVYVMRLMLIENYPELKKLPLLINEDLHKYQKETLSLLGISEDVLVKLPPNVVAICSDLIVPVCPRGTNLMKPGCHWLRMKMQKYRLPPAGKRIYVSRGTRNTRVMLNEEDVLKLLKKLDFEVVEPGELSVENQIKVFSQATVIVGANGAGLVNIVFSPENALVIELSDIILSQLNNFQVIADAIPLRYINIVSTDIRLYPRKHFHDVHDFVVDIDALEQALTYV